MLKSTRLQLLVSLAAVLAALGLLAVKGLPPTESILTAAYEGRTSMVHRALSWGADVDLEGDPEEPSNVAMSWPPLALAVEGGHKETTRLLLAHGADAQARYYPGDQWHTILEVAIGLGDMEIVALLIAYGADVNEEQPFGTRPLHHAETVEMAALLVDRGAAVNHRDDHGCTALHDALLYEGREAVAAYLVAHGADVRATNNNGRTPLHYAETVKMAELLIAHGAAVNPPDNDGETPLQRAARCGHEALADFLAARGATRDGNH